ncbi:MAG: ABC transporter ATP-binding protein, partial [Candidatus Methanomethylophilus sp.]|nr:ABC transporter ATP-binding protein [Methanomethylophilus sp.]MDY0247664.1 ABC transporter ATP-binding protein [Methanosarcina mazei]
MNLQAEDIEFSYGRSQILKGIGFELRPGEVLGIIGPNGSGKTTLIKCINRILEPSQGKVTIDSRDVLSMKVRDVARIMGYV